jgi:hypothetical protein
MKIQRNGSSTRPTRPTCPIARTTVVWFGRVRTKAALAKRVCNNGLGGLGGLGIAEIGLLKRNDDVGAGTGVHGQEPADQLEIGGIVGRPHGIGVRQ